MGDFLQKAPFENLEKRVKTPSKILLNFAIFLIKFSLSCVLGNVSLASAQTDEQLLSQTKKQVKFQNIVSFMKTIIPKADPDFL